MVTGIAEGKARTITYTLTAATKADQASGFAQTAACRQTSSPRTCLAKGLWLVTGLSATGPLPLDLSYAYRDAYADQGGRGFLEFTSRVVTDRKRNQVTEIDTLDKLIADTSTIPKYVYLTQETVEQTTLTPGKTLVVKTVSRDFDDASIVEGRLVRNSSTGQVTSSDCPQVGSSIFCSGVSRRQLSTTSLLKTYDAFGHVLKDQASTPVTGKTTYALRQVVTQYDPADTTAWLINKPNKISVRSVSPDGELGIRDTVLVSDGTKLVTRTNAGLDNVEYKQERFQYDARGRLTKVVTASAAGQADGAARQTVVHWDGPEGIYPSSVETTSAVNVFRTVEQTWQHPAFGYLIQQVDANKVMQRQTFDSAGRIMSSSDSRSTVPTSFTYALLDSATRWQITSTSGSEMQSEDLDVLGRVLNKSWSTTTNGTANEGRHYDVLGRVDDVKSSFSGNNYEATFGYDGLDCPTSQCSTVSRTLSATGTPAPRPRPNARRRRTTAGPPVSKHRRG